MSATYGKAVFLSYAHEDNEPARRIADALRAVGVEVWFDQSELRGGDAWDQKIRRQIRDCTLFVPVISANTQARLEGYFRIEWKLAAQRTHAMADEKAFLLPVMIDATHDGDARVPAEFRAVQWTKFKGGEISPGFAQQIRNLLDGNLAVQGFSPAAAPLPPPASGKVRALSMAPPPAERNDRSESSVAVPAFANIRPIPRGQAARR